MVPQKKIELLSEGVVRTAVEFTLSLVTFREVHLSHYSI